MGWLNPPHSPTLPPPVTVKHWVIKLENWRAGDRWPWTERIWETEGFKIRQQCKTPWEMSTTSPGSDMIRYTCILCAYKLMCSQLNLPYITPKTFLKWRIQELKTENWWAEEMRNWSESLWEAAWLWRRAGWRCTRQNVCPIQQGPVT